MLRSGLHLKHHLKFEYLQILPDCHLDCGVRHQADEPGGKALHADILETETCSLRYQYGGRLVVGSDLARFGNMNRPRVGGLPHLTWQKATPAGWVTLTRRVTPPIM